MVRLLLDPKYCRKDTEKDGEDESEAGSEEDEEEEEEEDDQGSDYEPSDEEEDALPKKRKGGRPPRGRGVRAKIAKKIGRVFDMGGSDSDEEADEDVSAAKKKRTTKPKDGLRMLF